MSHPPSILPAPRRGARGHTLRASLVLSVLMHAGAAGVFSWVGTRDFDPAPAGGEFTQLDVFQAFRPEVPATPIPVPLPPKPEEPPPPPEIDPDLTRLGIDDATEPSKTWKGAAKATEHQAQKSEVDQPALALSPGVPGPAELGAVNAGSPAAQMTPPSQPPQPAAAQPPTDAVPAAASEEPQPRPTQLEPRQDQPPQLDPPQPLPEQAKPQQLQPEQDLPAPPGASVVEVGPQQLDPLQPLVQQPDRQQPQEQQVKPLQVQDQQPAPARDASSPANAQPSAVPPTTPPPGTAAATAPGANASAPDSQPGMKAEEESAAAAVLETLTYRPGQPLAGKGLQVRTVNPRWGVTTMLTSSPKNTTIRITFGRTGKVLKAAFVDNGTGYPDVDGPLLDAVYRWTASGEVLKKIPPGNPSDPQNAQKGLNFDIKFILQHGATP